ncbi:hypothetical protein GJ496_007817 [Pomphorhynchus laevis]|nr:hypothetical protein GJ496_007817 [Pomphorhynchus laevis]
MHSLLDVYAAGVDMDFLTRKNRSCADDLLLQYSQLQSKPGVARFCTILEEILLNGFLSPFILDVKKTDLQYILELNSGFYIDNTFENRFQLWDDYGRRETYKNCFDIKGNLMSDNSLTCYFGLKRC